MNFAVVTGAGKGIRMKSSKNKVLLKIKGKEILFHTLNVFQKCKEVEAIVLTAGEEDVREFQKIVEENKFLKVKKIVLGGKERQDSVWKGIQALKELNAKKEDIVLVQDACRPLVEEKTIIECIKEAEKFGSSVAGVRTKDTIKKAGDDLTVKETLDRRELWNIQTPQTARLGVFLEAFEKAFQENFYGTDDVMLIERIGKKVKIVESSYENIKITTSEDLDIAEKILEKRQKNV